MEEVIRQGLPTGVQNSVISIGNMVVQTNINSFGAFAMSGHGAYAKIEGLVFMPIVSCLYLVNGIWSLFTWYKLYRKNS